MAIAKRKRKGKGFVLGSAEARALWLHVDSKRLAHGLAFGLLFALAIMGLTLHQASGKAVGESVGNGILVLATCTLYSLYLVSFEPRNFARFRQIAAVGVVSLVPLAAAAAFPRFDVPSELIPVTVSALIFGIVYSERTAISLSLMLCLLVGIALRGAGKADVPVANTMLILFGGAAAAALGCGKIRRRSKLLKVGIVSSLVQVALIIAATLRLGQPVEPQACILGVINGVGSAVVVTALLPIIEHIFNVTTGISLLELTDQSHPILRRLSLEAPGTYHHSLILGNLAEAAGEAIGANSLLLRVGAYFHDIGKIMKPEYFIENEGMQGSMHANLSPTMSTLVITAHTKDGVDLAREGGIPAAIIDLIQQHHGTSLVEFFYRQALEDSPDKERVDEALFRHPGPKPQTREAGVLMLADSVESASRALPDPTPSRIARQVHEIINRKLVDGQLDECDLTLAEVHKIERSLTRSLTSVFHGRIKYPEPEQATSAREHNDH